MSANPYDPVTTTDTSNLADDDWGLSLPGVRYKNYYGGNSRCKGICQTIRDRPKLSALVALTIVGVVLLVVIVAVATGGGETKRHPTGKEPNWEAQTEGLEFYPIPEDKSIVISYNVRFMGNKDHIKAILDNVTEPYQNINQLDEKIYTKCTADHHPANKTCQLHRTRFGDDCTSTHDYGYKHAMPCVFFQLNLPDNVTIRPITSQSPLWTAARYFIEDHNDTTYVPFTCQGKTHADRESIGVKGIAGDAIQYMPEDGFPAYFYRERDANLPFLKPAVMVRLTTLKDEYKVHITCTAWGQLFHYDGSLVDHDLLATEFAVYIRHS